ncbi:MAG: RDD family protein [Chitinophagales bacterium]
MSITFTCEKCGGGSYEQFSQTQVRCLHCGSISIYDTGYRPMPEFQLSYDKNLLDFEKKTDYIVASLGKRFANYIIDLFIVVFILLLVSNIFDLSKIITTETNDNITAIFLLIIMPVYYVFMEYKFGKTVGKFLTKTKVISTDGNELTLGQCVGRLLCRIIPFERFSGLFTNGVFWHDSIPKTLVVEDN